MSVQLCLCAAASFCANIVKIAQKCYPRNEISTPAATAEPMTPAMFEAMQ